MPQRRLAAPLLHPPILKPAAIMLLDGAKLTEYAKALRRSTTAHLNTRITRSRPGDWHEDITIQIDGTTFPTRPHAYSLDPQCSGWVLLGCVRTAALREYQRTIPGVGKSRTGYVLVGMHNSGPSAVMQRVAFATPLTTDADQLRRLAQIEWRLLAH